MERPEEVSMNRSTGPRLRLAALFQLLPRPPSEVSETSPPSERRDRPRQECAPVRWQDIAQRANWERLPFSRYFAELAPGGARKDQLATRGARKDQLATRGARSEQFSHERLRGAKAISETEPQGMAATRAFD